MNRCLTQYNRGAGSGQGTNSKRLDQSANLSVYDITKAKSRQCSAWDMIFDVKRMIRMIRIIGLIRIPL